MKSSPQHIILLASIVIANGTLSTEAIASAPSSSSFDVRSSGKLQANGISIAYESRGPMSGETVLLIMGTGGQLTQWLPDLLAELVRRGFRVVCYDHRDVGLSTHLDAAGLPDWMAIGAAFKAGKHAPLASRERS